MSKLMTGCVCVRCEAPSYTEHTGSNGTIAYCSNCGHFWLQRHFGEEGSDAGTSVELSIENPYGVLKVYDDDMLPVLMICITKQQAKDKIAEYKERWAVLYPNLQKIILWRFHLEEKEPLPHVVFERTVNWYDRIDIHD